MNYDWVDRVIEDTSNGKIYKRCIQSGIDHLPCKKLYKYYSFSSKFTIPNIKDSLIYLQNPTEFNDPFDCNIGISVNQLFRIVFPNLFDEILPNTNSAVREILGSWMLGEPSFGLRHNAKEKLLSLLSKSRPFIDLIKKSNKGEEISDKDFLSFLLADPITSLEILKCYFELESEEEPFALDEKEIQQIIKAPQIVKSLIDNYSDIKDEKTQKVVEILTSNEDFIKKIELFAEAFNINYQKNDLYNFYSSFDDCINQIRDKLGKQIGVECFTQSPTDILMWSYYADKHRGICVEYDFSKLFSTLSNSFLFPVFYSENRPLLNLEKLYDPISKELIQNGVVAELPNIVRSLIIKSSEWEREKEWRIISLSIKSDDDRKIKLPIISRIITGINISDENYRKIAEIANEKNIPIQRTRPNSEKYIVEIIND